MPRPGDAAYLDEKSVRDELTRVAQVCVGCRRCVDLCTTFPTLFDLIGSHPDLDAGRLTPAEQDRAVDGCFQCGHCVSGCPYAPGIHDLQVDVPTLMLRAVAMQHATGRTPVRSRLGTRVLTGTGVLARAARAPVGSLRRRALALVSDVSPRRTIGAFRRPRFSTWLSNRPAPLAADERVTVFPTCLVEREATAVGRAFVAIAERNGLECSLSAVGCCGAPWLHAGDLDRFRKVAKRNVRTLAREIRLGGDCVVLQPRCAEVIRREYVEHVGGADAEFVASRANDSVDHLMGMHRDGRLDGEFPGDVPARVVYHAPDGRRPRPATPVGADLLALTGAGVTVVDRSAGVGVTWGLRSSHDGASIMAAERLVGEIRALEADTVVGDDHRDNEAIADGSGIVPRHPLEVIADAYGIHTDR